MQIAGLEPKRAIAGISYHVHGQHNHWHTRLGGGKGTRAQGWLDDEQRGIPAGSGSRPSSASSGAVEAECQHEAEADDFDSYADEDGTDDINDIDDQPSTAQAHLILPTVEHQNIVGPNLDDVRPSPMRIGHRPISFEIE